MTCPECAGKVKVLDNVYNNAENETYRRKQCLNCGLEFFTVEYEVIVTEQFKADWLNNYRRKQ